MSYDIKYRRRTIEHWNDGHSKRATAAVFKVSTSTLQKWKSQLKETGNLEAKKRRKTWRKIESVKSIEYLEQNPDVYLKEISENSRQEFVERLETVSSESLVYVDEMGIDQCLYREYARAPRG